MALNHKLNRDCYRPDGVLADAVIGYIAEGLSNECDWLDYIFGKAERLVKVVKGKKVFTPNFYAGFNEYIQLLPDDIAGNYCFFTLDDSQDIDLNRSGRQVVYKTPFSIVFWFDLRRVANDFRDIESLKMEILTVLNTIPVKFGAFTINRIYEKAENVWEGFTVDESDNQCMMHPFAGLRFEGELTVKTFCNQLI